MSAESIVLTLLFMCGFIAIYSELSANKGGKGAAKAKPKKQAAKPGQPGKTLLVKSQQSRDPEQYEATGGAELPEVLAAAARLASEKGQPVKVGFNRRPGEKQYRVFPGGYFELTN